MIFVHRTNWENSGRCPDKHGTEEQNAFFRNVNHTDPSQPFVSVIIPAFNEQESIRATVEETRSVLTGIDCEIIVVDDGSADGTWAALRELELRIPGLRGVKFARNFGHQAALLAGLRAARGRAVVTMDADGQHPPRLIMEMIPLWRAGALVVQSLRAGDEDLGLLKRVTSRQYYRLFSWLAGTPMRPGSADFRLLDRKVVDLVLAHPRSALFLRGFIPWMGFPTAFLPFAPAARRAGETKYSLPRMLGLAREGVLRFSVKPLRLATLLGTLTCLGSLAYLAYVLAVRLLGGDYVSGWASMTGLLCLLGGVQLLLIGVLGEYVGMIFEGQLGRPTFVVAEELGPSEEPEPAPSPARDA